MGDPTRITEYSSIDKVEVDQREARVHDGVGCKRRCYFPGGLTFDEVVRWFDPPYSFVSGAPSGAALVAGDISVVTLEPLPLGRTLFTWRVYHDYPNLAEMTAGYEPGLNEIARRLAARFGGYVVAPAALQPREAPVAP